mmetsp:Transcript_11015/g.21443  ORF Transcript_11015/g.21443 Transcript_11015/m.21443 type:complete len:204 (+) Transcript_11015:283-894(+)
MLSHQMRMLGQRRHQRIYENHQSGPQMLSNSKVFLLPIFTLLSHFCYQIDSSTIRLRLRSHLLRQFLQIHKPHTLHPHPPPIVTMNLNMMPSPPIGMSHENKGRFPKRRIIIQLIIPPHVLRKLHTPHGIYGSLGPPRTPAKIVFHYDILRIGNDRLSDGIVTPLDALHEFQSVDHKPRSGNASSASHVQYRFDAKVVNHVFP